MTTEVHAWGSAENPEIHEVFDSLPDDERMRLAQTYPFLVIRDTHVPPNDDVIADSDKMVTVEIADFGFDYYETEDAFAFKKRLACALNSIPKKYRSSAKICLGYAHDEHANIVVKYERPETVQEKAERDSKALKNAARRLSEERALYERLRKKFEGIIYISPLTRARRD